MVKEITEDELDELIKTKKIVIVDFSAVWCMPCKSLGKVLEEKVAPKLKDRDDVALVKIDIDKNRGIAEGLQIMSVPSMMFFFKGQRIVFQGENGQNEDRIVGFAPNIDEIIFGLIEQLDNTPETPAENL
ncbi:MAG: thioredoxin family protein [Candidatus Lokiarchaeota archaeon]|nr:thioredoxin family protein [Candidatus Harpocratesius repetitus]